MSTEPELEKARQLVKRYDSRKLYSFIGEKWIRNDVAKRVKTVTE